MNVRNEGRYFMIKLWRFKKEKKSISLMGSLHVNTFRDMVNVMVYIKIKIVETYQNIELLLYIIIVVVVVVVIILIIII